MSTVLLDTVGLIALWDETDQWHAEAKQAYDRIKAARFLTVATDAILLECGNAAARRPYRQHVTLLRSKLLARGRLVYLSDDEWDVAWDAFNKGSASGAGIVDQASFVVMHRLGIRQAFTNDRHFTAAGFETLF